MVSIICNKMRYISIYIIILVLVSLAPGLSFAEGEAAIWDMSADYKYANPTPLDIYEDIDKETGANIYNQVITLFRNYEWGIQLGQLSAVAVTMGLKDDIEQHLSMILDQSIVTTDLADMTNVVYCGGAPNVWRMGEPINMTRIFLLAFTIDDAKFMVAVSPDDGLAEVRILVDYGGDIEGFNETANRYLDLDGALNAEDDYRPVYMYQTPAGWLPPDEDCEYGFEGYVINVNSIDINGIVRSTERGYFGRIGDDWVFYLGHSIEYSLSYSLSE